MNTPLPQVYTSLEDAARALLECAFHADRPTVIAITGPVGAGKSSLATAVSTCVIATDSYLPDYDLVPIHERDLPAHAHLDELAASLRALRDGMTMSIPVWSFQTHRREGMREQTPERVIVCEGIHAFDERLDAVTDVKVYVDAPREIRWSRWEEIERRGERGWGVERAREYFDAVAEPTFALRAATWRACADVIVENVERLPNASIE